ncbi:Regulator of protease activity HflC, stomatin/prohibitin superfamily [Halopseudomonas xinjiangensis]|uniref:Regulator of protease activity HflC, stomatin/prohibitin superfamily n=1 Tax=Halopseudomonas xinjiangensis TaxID=487184 RepID=A0A1H1YGB6_9GAMM|nr:stomatin-like protein [Halopseudomonas xinjiangensis]SDT20066.1 Regulator of protease activity HflC, stomatin/prohibitin superfamily [Halopseudomonas xinjiangensis]
MEIATIVSLAVLVLVIVTIAKTAQIVPQRSAYVVERLGKYTKTLDAGFHLLIPFVDRIAYRHTLKEEAIDVDRQACVTKDNIQVVVNGVIYLQVVDPKAASYGINDYRYAAMQLAQTTLRSVVGKIDLDKTFEERETINIQVVQALDEAARPWGVKVMRYEIADIELPATILDALEKQMRAERERRAVVAQSEGERQAKINVSEGQKQETINLSEAEKQRQINEAEGRARQIELIALATAEGLRQVAEAINTPGGKDAVGLRVAEQYVEEFGKLAKTNNTMILPAELTNIGSAVAAITKTMEQVNRP